MSSDLLILSCEHATAHVPAPYRRMFGSASAKRALSSHRGLDIGALTVAAGFRRAFRCRLFQATVTRLLVDTNRSPRHARLHSEFSRSLQTPERARVLDAYYYPYRLQVKGAVESGIDSGRRVVHVSLHTFTPRLAGHVRTADVGLLYDPARSAEATLAARWRERLLAEAPAYRVRRNYPYRGDQDGLTTWLRSVFPAKSYVGIELEVNQRFFLREDAERTALLVSALTATLPLHAKGGSERRP